MKSPLPRASRQSKDWRKHTLQCYRLALKLFTESCPKTYIDEIDGDDLRRFKIFLRTLKTSIGKTIDPRNVWNHFNNTVAFLNTYGRRDLIKQSEWPMYEEKGVAQPNFSGSLSSSQFSTGDPGSDTNCRVPTAQTRTGAD